MTTTRVVSVSFDDVDSLSSVVRGRATVEVATPVDAAAAAAGVGSARLTVNVELRRVDFAMMLSRLVRERDALLEALPPVIPEKGAR